MMFYLLHHLEHRGNQTAKCFIDVLWKPQTLIEYQQYKAVEQASPQTHCINDIFPLQVQKKVSFGVD
jgi:hypothetical protein